MQASDAGEYEHLARTIDRAMADEELYDAAKSDVDGPFPIEVTDRLLAGENPVKVYREYRGLTQNQLATTIALNVVYPSQIETGKRTGSAKTLAALAGALNVNVDDLIV